MLGLGGCLPTIHTDGYAPKSLRFLWNVWGYAKNGWSNATLLQVKNVLVSSRFGMVLFKKYVDLQSITFMITYVIQPIRKTQIKEGNFGAYSKYFRFWKVTHAGSKFMFTFPRISRKITQEKTFLDAQCTDWRVVAIFRQLVILLFFVNFGQRVVAIFGQKSFKDSDEPIFSFSEEQFVATVKCWIVMFKN